MRKSLLTRSQTSDSPKDLWTPASDDDVWDPDEDSSDESSDESESRQKQPDSPQLRIKGVDPLLDVIDSSKVLSENTRWRSVHAGSGYAGSGVPKIAHVKSIPSMREVAFRNHEAVAVQGTGSSAATARAAASRSRDLGFTKNLLLVESPSPDRMGEKCFFDKFGRKRPELVGISLSVAAVEREEGAGVSGGSGDEAVGGTSTSYGTVTDGVHKR